MACSNTSCSAVLDIPELVSLVCESAPVSDCAVLLRVSRLFFDCAAPLVWKNIHGVTKLFSLLDGASTHTEDAGHRRSNIIITLKEGLDFSRFDYYAGLIRTFEVFERRCDILVFHDWSILHSRIAARGKPLIPNLIELACREAPSEQSHDTIINWVNLFLTPDLVELRVPNPNGDICAMFTWLAPMLVSNMLNTVSAKCPSLKTLEVSPGTNQTDAPLEFDIPLDTRLHEHIARFDSLRTLVTSAAALEPGMLQALGQLPRLEALSVVSSHQHEPIMRLVPLPRNAFPVLERLELRRLSLRAIMTIWYTKGLVEKLTSVVIAQPILDDWTPRNWAGELMSHVCRESSGLLDFYLDPYYYASQVVYLCEADLKLLQEQRIMLNSLTLCGTLMDRNVTNQDFANAFPNLQVLRLPSWRLSWDCLRDLAGCLPKLHTLSVSLDLWHTTIPEKSRCISSEPLSLELNWSFPNSPSSSKLTELAKFLCVTWPSVKCAFLRGLRLDHRAMSTLQRLNERISDVRRQKRIEAGRLSENISATY
ncbi:hypothetical protein RhiLY_06389 [Ceratobasidium sp. AG-Ba]|nr:hypothetical protein RhiLY_06389 [Ceratobasidium sp. AG-Ba]